MSKLDDIEAALRKKHALPDDFRFFRWACLPEDGPTLYYECEGAVPVEWFQRGPRKGKVKSYELGSERKLRLTVEEFRKMKEDADANQPD